MLPYLSTNCPFPPVDKALEDPNGLLAAGADLSPPRLIDAYRNGIFPWYSEGEPILWWSPNPRTVFDIDSFKVKKSVKQTLKRKLPIITVNQDFDQVIRRCSLPRSDDNGTWITDEMIEAYSLLHQLGYAHSLEVWIDKQLVGGIYGVAFNGVFCGESMFSEISNGSKIALSCLIKYLWQFDYKLIDCQVENPHLTSLGAINIPREQYLKILQQKNPHASQQMIWRTQNLDWAQLIFNDKTCSKL
ncbi:leucyl/phenylalanyl-tRNA--protein transferase [Aliikangiella sp. G2MR2-5]|uniref:leucyl/phenylalanyl-tRNA--protein transferase n=1 Tax=Aliikangiella sp. G2MR2-5 TaxID=2788943 RepID=UPI0018AC5F03|nr:leucyl/phenylalanyl-tRNA--protein transferase [Aliikangiella sp. G2MR2-5]